MLESQFWTRVCCEGVLYTYRVLLCSGDARRTIIAFFVTLQRHWHRMNWACQACLIFFSRWCSRQNRFLFPEVRFFHVKITPDFWTHSHGRPDADFEGLKGGATCSEWLRLSFLIEFLWLCVMWSVEGGGRRALYPNCWVVRVAEMLFCIWVSIVETLGLIISCGIFMW